jgi:predicted Zn-dependent protease
MIDAEWVLLRRAGDEEVESFGELSRRRLDDIAIEAAVAARALQTADLLAATPSPDYRGPVVLRGTTLATFMNSGVLHALSSAATKFTKLSRWEIGEPVFRGAMRGDPLTVFANRRLPFGTSSSCFDDEGLPAQRVELIRDGRLATFIAGQRYADYLGLPATGAFGNLELAAGDTPAASLLGERHVEIVEFSWFRPDPITGDFASEIRLGYIVDGERRTPFKGGALVGNMLDALANVRWSAETGFAGDYQGPAAARFGELVVAGAT